MYSPVEERRWTFGARHRPLRSYHSSSSIGAFQNPPRSASVVRRQPPPVGSPQRHRRTTHSLRYTNPEIQKMSGAAHFHYQLVELGPVQVAHEPIPRQTLVHPATLPDVPCWRFRVDSNGRSWTLLRSYRQLIDFDRQLHRCVFDRRYSRLNEFRAVEDEQLALNSLQQVSSDIEAYVGRFSELAGSLITCYPVLKWLELDSRGNRFMPAEETPINTPAVAAAFVVREYTASACDELTLKLGDIVSVIEMPPVTGSGDTSWWKGKLTIARNRMTASDTNAVSEALKLDDNGCGPSFDVGYFPSTCVQVFGAKTPTDRTASIVDQLTDSAPGPTDHLIEGEKRGKVMTFMRDFLKTRSTRHKLHDSGIMSKRIFGCDLSEHLTNSNLDVPLVLQKCVATVEKHGIVTGIYRQSGVQSNIQRLRQAFDEGGSPDLDDSMILRDIHCVSSLLKQYFRELPNPLFTYQLFHQFADAMATSADQKLKRYREIIKKLPPPHYRTAEYLMSHLTRLCRHSSVTDMTSRNLAIVWAPNLFRPPPTGDADDSMSSSHLLRGLDVQTGICDFVVANAEALFATDDSAIGSVSIQETDGGLEGSGSRLIDLGAAQRKLSAARHEKIPDTAGLPDLSDRACIDVNGGPAALPKKFHTVIDIPSSSAKNTTKHERPLPWRALFGRSTSNTVVTSPKTDTSSAMSAAQSEEAARTARDRQKGWDQRRSAQLRRRSGRQQQQQQMNTSSSTHELHPTPNYVSHSPTSTPREESVRWRLPRMRSVRSEESLIAMVTRNVEECKERLVHGWRQRGDYTRTVSSVDYVREPPSSSKTLRPTSLQPYNNSGSPNLRHSFDVASSQPYTPADDMPYMETDFDSESPQTKELRSRDGKPRTSPNYARPSKVARVVEGTTAVRPPPVIADPNDDYAVVSDEQQPGGDYAEIAPLLRRGDEADQTDMRQSPPTLLTQRAIFTHGGREDVGGDRTTDRIDERGDRQRQRTPPKYATVGDRGTVETPMTAAGDNFVDNGSRDYTPSDTASSAAADEDRDSPSLLELSDFYSSCESADTSTAPANTSSTMSHIKRVSFAVDQPRERDVLSEHSAGPSTLTSTHLKTSSVSFETINSVLQSLENLDQPTSPSPPVRRPHHRSSSSGSIDSLRLELSRYDNVSPLDSEKDEDERDATPTGEQDRHEEENVMTASRLSDSKLLSSTQSASYRQQHHETRASAPPPLSGRGRQPDMASMMALLEGSGGNRRSSRGNGWRDEREDDDDDEEEDYMRTTLASKGKSRSVDRAPTPPAFYDQPDAPPLRGRSTPQEPTPATSFGDQLKDARPGQRTSVAVYYL